MLTVVLHDDERVQCGILLRGLCVVLYCTKGVLCGPKLYWGVLCGATCCWEGPLWSSMVQRGPCSVIHCTKVLQCVPTFIIMLRGSYVVLHMILRGSSCSMVLHCAKRVLYEQSMCWESTVWSFIVLRGACVLSVPTLCWEVPNILTGSSVILHFAEMALCGPTFIHCTKRARMVLYCAERALCGPTSCEEAQRGPLWAYIMLIGSFKTA